jgi:hypothetical protein
VVNAGLGILIVGSVTTAISTLWTIPRRKDPSTSAWTGMTIRQAKVFRRIGLALVLLGSVVAAIGAFV